MISLAIDTAGKNCAACLYDSENGSVLAELSEEIGKGHAERLMGIVTDVMAQADMSYQDIEKIITSIGPGSFTGVRVGVATARGFGLGLDIPVVGVTNLEGLMVIADQDANLSSPIAALIKAGRDQAYGQFNFDCSWAKAQTPFIAPVSQIVSVLNQQTQPVTLIGDGSSPVSQMLEVQFIAIENISQADIATIAKIGAARPHSDEKPEPLYLRKPDAMPQMGFAVERAI